MLRIAIHACFYVFVVAPLGLAAIAQAVALARMALG